MPLFFAHLQLAASKESATELTRQSQRKQSTQHTLHTAPLTRRARVRSPSSVVFPKYLEYRSFCGSVYTITPADTQWLHAVTQQLRQTTSPCDITAFGAAETLEKGSEQTGENDSRDQRCILQLSKKQHVPEQVSFKTAGLRANDAATASSGVWKMCENEGLAELLSLETTAALMQSCRIQLQPSFYFQDTQQQQQQEEEAGMQLLSTALRTCRSLENAEEGCAQRCNLSRARHSWCVAPPAMEIVLAQWQTHGQALSVTSSLPGRCTNRATGENEQARFDGGAQMESAVAFSSVESAAAVQSSLGSPTTPQRFNQASSIDWQQQLLGDDAEERDTELWAAPHPVFSTLTKEKVPTAETGTATEAVRAQPSPSADSQRISPSTLLPQSISSEDVMRAKVCTFVRSLKPLSATGMLSWQRCEVDLRVWVKAMRGHQRRLAAWTCELKEPSCWWTWWRLQTDKDERCASEMMAAVVDKEHRLAVTCESKGAADGTCEGTRGLSTSCLRNSRSCVTRVCFLRGPSKAELLDASSQQEEQEAEEKRANAASRVPTAMNAETSNCVVSHRPGLSLTQHAVRELWQSVAKAMLSARSAEESNRASVACGACAAATHALLQSTEAADVLSLLQQGKRSSSCENASEQRVPSCQLSTLSCWYDVSSLSKHLYQLCKPELLYPSRQTSAEATESQMSDKVHSCVAPSVSATAFSGLRAASWLPWQSETTPLVSVAESSLLLPRSSQHSLCWLNAPAQYSRCAGCSLTSSRAETFCMKAVNATYVCRQVTLSVDDLADLKKQRVCALKFLSPSADAHQTSVLSDKFIVSCVDEVRRRAFAVVNDRWRCLNPQGGDVAMVSHDVEKDAEEQEEEEEKEDHARPVYLSPRTSRKRQRGVVEIRADSYPKAESSSSASLLLTDLAEENSPTAFGDGCKAAAAEWTLQLQHSCTAAQALPPATQNVLGDDASFFTECSATHQTNDDAARKVAAQQFAAFLAQRDAAVQQRRDACVRQTILASLLREVTIPSSTHFQKKKTPDVNCSSKSAKSCSRRFILAAVEAQREVSGCTHAVNESPYVQSDINPMRNVPEKAENSRSLLSLDDQLCVLRHCTVRPLSVAHLGSLSVTLRTAFAPHQMKVFAADGSVCFTDGSGLKSCEANKQLVTHLLSSNCISMAPTSQSTHCNDGDELRQELLRAALHNDTGNFFRMPCKASQPQLWTFPLRASLPPLQGTQNRRKETRRNNSSTSTSDAVAMKPANTFLSTHWPLFTLRNIAAERLASVQQASDEKWMKETSVGAVKVRDRDVKEERDDVGHKKHAANEHNIFFVQRVQTRRQTRYEVQRRSFYQLLLKHGKFSQNAKAFSAQNTQAGEKLPGASPAEAWLSPSYARELASGDVAQLDYCVRSLLAHELLTCPADAHCCILGEDETIHGVKEKSASLSGPCSGALCCGGERACEATKETRHNTFSSLRHLLTHQRRTTVPSVEHCVLGLDCAPAYYQQLLHKLRVNGMQRDGWLVFHTYWHEALASCLASAAAASPRSDASEVEDENAACGGGTSGSEKGLFYTGGALHDAARCEVRWTVDTEDDDEEEEGAGTEQLRGMHDVTSGQHFSDSCVEHTSAPHQLPFARSCCAVAASCRFLFFDLKEEEEEASGKQRFESAESLFEPTDNVHPLMEVDFYPLLRQHAAQLLSGESACLTSASRPAEEAASSHLPGASVLEIEREVQPLRRRRYTRHVFSLEEERMFLLDKKLRQRRQQQWKQSLSESGAVPHTENRVSDTGAAKAAEAKRPFHALSLCEDNFSDLTDQQFCLEMRQRIYAQHRRAPVGSLWQRARGVGADCLWPLPEAQAADATVHFTFMQYLLRDRAATLGTSLAATSLE